MRQTAADILHEFREVQSDDPEQQKLYIIGTASKFIREDLRAVQTATDCYPASNDIKFEAACLA